MARTLAAGEVTRFHEDGYVIVKKFLNREEIDKHYQTTIVAGASSEGYFLKKEKDPAL